MIPHVDRWGNRGTEHSMTPHQRHMCEVAKQHLDVGSVDPPPALLPTAPGRPELSPDD